MSRGLGRVAVIGCFHLALFNLSIDTISVVETAWMPDSFGLNGALPQVSTLPQRSPHFDDVFH